MLALVPPKHIVKELLGIMQAAPDTCEYPVGVLTTEHRDNWLRTRQELMQGREGREGGRGGGTHFRGIISKWPQYRGGHISGVQIRGS